MTERTFLLDQRQRPLRDLRISITDRCNFRCSYCMPKEVFDSQYSYLPQSSLLSFEEITRLAGIFAAQGVQKIRLTGGEPLLRKNIEVLIEMLAKLKTQEGKPLDITLTTNGSLLKKKAQSLADAGLKRITVSLDGLDDAIFRRMNDVDFPVADVLEGIAVAKAAGLGNEAIGNVIKVNMVIKRGVNDDQIIPMAKHFRGTGIVLRFIEYMDVGSTNGWEMRQVLPSKEVVARIQSEWPLIPLEPQTTGETAARWGYANALGIHDTQAGEFGVISSVTEAFCSDCNRARLSTEGKLYLCLFAHQGHDLRQLLRGGDSNDSIAERIQSLWQARSDNYSEQRASGANVGTTSSIIPIKRVEMSYIGG